MNKCPNGWKLAKLGDIAKRINDIWPDRKEWYFERYISGNNFDPGEIVLERSNLIKGNENVIGYQFKWRFQPGDTLYVVKNPRLRKAAIVDFEGICSISTFVIRTDKTQFLQELLPYLLQTEGFVFHACNHAHGSTNPFLNWKDIANYEFYMAPLNQQKKIYKILYSIEDNIAKQRKLIRLVEKMRSVILDELLRKGTSHKRFKKTEMGNLPGTWHVQKLGTVSTIKARIGWRGLKSAEYTIEGPHLIAATHIIGSKVDWDICDHISDFRYEESPEIKLEKGDTILSKDGTIGRVAFIDELPNKATINTTMMLIRPIKEIFIPKFIFYYLQGEVFQGLIRSRLAGSTIPHIFQRDMKNLFVPIMPKDEQLAIVRIIENIDETLKTIKDDLIMKSKLKKKLTNDLLSGDLIISEEVLI